MVSGSPDSKSGNRIGESRQASSPSKQSPATRAMTAGGAGAVRRAVDRACAGARGARRALTRFAPRPSAFGAAADAEAAAVRAVRNARTFRYHYAALQWGLLLASLAAAGHRASVVFLMAASKVLIVCVGFLGAFPRLALLRRLVAAAFVALVLADLVAAGAVANLMAALAVGVPVIVLHASFRARDDLEGPSAENGEEEEEEEAAVVEKKEDGDVEAGPTRRSTAVAPRSPK
uniref:Uncharacterized protein n=1 Tax=Avena sativa TaxID=4498 RepID=A0ACD5U4Q2_AVESA